MDNTQQKGTETQPAAKPVKTIRVEDCSASIWPRTATVNGESRTFYSVTFERSYKDKDGKYQYTRNFDPESLQRLVDLIGKTGTALIEMTQAK